MPQKAVVAVPKDYLAALNKKVKDLGSLMEVSAIISSTFDFKKLLALVMDKAKKVMDAEACSILLYNRETDKLEFELALCGQTAVSRTLREKVSLDMGEGIAGWVAKNRKPLIIEDTEKDSRFCKEADRLTGFRTRSLVAAPLIGRSGLIGVAEILNPKKRCCFNAYDAEMFQAYCRQISVAIENARFHHSCIEREKIRREMEIASSVQKSFLPERSVIRKGSVTASAVNVSASKVGGDLYDFIKTPDGRAGILIGDVSGKGVSAALYMARVISEFRYIAHSTKTIAETLTRLNSALMASPHGMFLTAVYLVADTVTGELELSVAGHPPFFYLTQGKTKVVTMPAGPPLGIVPAEYPVSPMSLKKGDRLILLTDGVFDAKNRRGKRIGFERITRFIRGHMKDRQLIRRVVDYVDDFSKGAERTDDLTLVEVRRV